VVPLTLREFDLLHFLLRHPGQPFSRGELLQRVWGAGFDGYEHTVNSHINRLRSKIEDDPREPRGIVTVWGVGYRFDPSRQPAHEASQQPRSPRACRWRWPAAAGLRRLGGAAGPAVCARAGAESLQRLSHGLAQHIVAHWPEITAADAPGTMARPASPCCRC
jgi:hypothetical protein